MPKIKLNILTRPRNCSIAILPVLFLPLILSACNTRPLLEGVDDAYHKDEVVAIKQNAGGTTPVKTEMSAGADESEIAAPAQKQVKLDADSLFSILAAEFAGNIGDTEASLEYYRQAAQSVEDSRIAARTAYIALYGEKYDEALAALDRWRELEPNAVDLPRMYAITWLKLAQPEKAVPYIEELLATTDEASVEEAIIVKKLLAKEASTHDAYVVLQQLNARGDKENTYDKNRRKNKHLLVLQSRYAAQLKKYDESLATLDQVLLIDPSMHEVLIIKVRILIAQGKQEEASILINQVLEDYPENTVLRRQYARMLVEQNKLKAAIEQFSIVHEKLPDDGEIALSLALLYIETNNLDAAVEVLEHLIKIDKKVPIANYYLARIVQNRGDEKQAIAYYLRVKTGDYAFDAQLRVGVLLAMLGRPDEGLAKLETLAAVHNNWALQVRAYLAQGEVLRKLQRYDDGVEMYSQALQQKPEDTSLLYARGLMAEKIDRLDMAEADLLKVIAIEPDNADALNALGYTLADRTTRYDEALVYIKKAAELKPDDPAILDSLGWVNYRLGNMDEALKWMSKAFEKFKDAEIAAHYGEVLWFSNQKDKARKVWNKAKEINAKHPVLIETLERINP